MKSFFAPLLLAVCFTLTTVATTRADNGSARKQPQVSTFQSGVYTNAEGKLTIMLDKQKGGALSMKLVNKGGKVLFDQQIGKRQTVCQLRLDLSGLPDGAYELLISNGRDVTVHGLTLNTQPVAVSNRLVTLN